jgi:hypothetical protein
MSPKREGTYRRFAPRAQHKIAVSEFDSQNTLGGSLRPAPRPCPLAFAALVYDNILYHIVMEGALWFDAHLSLD